MNGSARYNYFCTGILLWIRLVSSSMANRAKVNIKPCRFCDWAENLFNHGKIHEDLLLKGTKKVRVLGKGVEWFAVLDKEPRVDGHTLLISRCHYPDLSFMSPQNLGDFFEGLVKVVRHMKSQLRLGEYGKIYMMSMSDHWNDDEIRSDKHTEHLHIHLLPRYPLLRTPEQAMEHLFLEEAKERDQKYYSDMIRKLRLPN